MIARARPGRTLLALCALCWLAFPAQASDESLANRPFVEGAKLIRTAEEEAGFVRLVRNPRIFERPSSIMTAWRQVESWLAADSAWIPLPTERHREVPRPLIPIPLCWWLCKSAHVARVWRTTAAASSESGARAAMLWQGAARIMDAVPRKPAGRMALNTGSRRGTGPTAAGG